MTRTLQILIALALCATSFAAADPPFGGDAPGSAADARDTTQPGLYFATLPTGDVDWYRIAVEAFHQVTITVTPTCPDNLDLTLYQGDGATVAAMSANGGCASETVTCIAETNELLYFKVAAVGATSGLGSYSIHYVDNGLAIPLLPTDFCHV